MCLKISKIIYNKTDYCMKYKLCTTSLDNDGNLCWKNKD